jgi:23S rRNA pseudouridine1911/1915/1917 synthase
MKWKIYRFTADNCAVGQRLDIFLAANENSLSRTKIKKIIDLGGVHVNGRRVRSCSTVVKAKDNIEVYVDHLALDPFRIDDSHIIYQDKYLIVLNKPAAIDTQPTHARYKGTLYEALQWHLKDPYKPHQQPEIGMIQRLDRGTTGIIVFSIHAQAHKPMTRIFLEHELEKRYLALVHNSPDDDEGEIISFLARSRKENRVHSVSNGGKEAITRYRVIEKFESASLVELELITGRSHQIRAHMSELGCPLIGDVRYDGQAQICGIDVDRPLLHANRLTFQHPVVDQKLDFIQDIPADMKQILSVLSGDKS